MGKEYPAFIIDRSRRSEASRFSDDFIVCTDKEVGFIARVYALPKSRRDEFERQLATMSAATVENRYLSAVVGESMCILEVVRMLREPVAHINRLRPLMKKAMKAYLHGEAQFVRGEGSPYDEQIAAVRDMLRTMESQRDRMVDVNGEAATERYIRATKAAIESLSLLKKIVKHE